MAQSDAYKSLPERTDAKEEMSKLSLIANVVRSEKTSTETECIGGRFTEKDVMLTPRPSTFTLVLYKPALKDLAEELHKVSED